MKILIAADMEGVTGVTCWNHVDAAHSEYPRFRRLMTEDVNAAIRGAYNAGADQVVVSDGHSNGRNILIEELDPRARLNSGSPSPYSMVQGIDEGIDGVVFIGYHARVGTQNAILEHTWSSKQVSNMMLNGEPFGEIGINAAIAGFFNTPVLLISGDQSACAEAEALIPGIEQVVVKWANGRMAAELLTPSVTQEKIQIATAQAVQRLMHGQAPQPLRLSPPIQMTIDFVNSEMADKAAQMPGTTRLGRRIEYTATDIPTLYKAFRASLSLARD